MTNLWVTFSTDSSVSFGELSGNIIYNVNNLYNFNGNLVDTSSNFIIYELTNNPIQANVTLQDTNWKQLNLNTILNPFQGYWLGGINTNLPQITLKYTISASLASSLSGLFFFSINLISINLNNRYTIDIMKAWKNIDSFI